MKGLIFLLFFLTSVSLMAQDRVSAQELIDIFSMEKDSAIKYVEGKEFENYEPQIRALFVSKESSLFFKRKDDSGLSMALEDNRIWALLYFDSLKNVQKLLDELKNSGWKLSKKKDGHYEVYENKQKAFSIAYHMSLEDNTHMIQLENRFLKQ